MMDNPNLYGFGEEEAPAPTDAELRTVATLVARLAEVQARKDRLEQELKDTNKELAQLSENDLPEALIAAGHVCPSKETIAGHKIEFTEKFRCGQMSDQASKDGKNPANPDGLRWLEENGHGDLIKRMVAVAIPNDKDSAKTAKEIEEFIRSHRAANKLRLMNQNTVHPQTLAGFAREQCEQQVDVPLATLKVQRIRSVKVVS